jgi:hypothetical protein
LEWGLVGELHAIRLDKEKAPMLTGDQEKILAQKTDELLKLAEFRTRQYLKKNWGLVRTLTAKLVKAGDITGETFEDIKTKFAARETVRYSKSPQAYSCSQMVRQTRLTNPEFLTGFAQ